MKNDPVLLQEETLDPADWNALRTLGHKMIDDMFDYLQQVRQRPVWKAIPADTKQHFKNSLPYLPQQPENIYQEFTKHILPYTKGNIHPRFWSWVEGGGTPLGMLADMLAAGMNPNNAIGDHVAMYVENQVIDWSKQMFGFPDSSTGILLSGGSIANITALIAARNQYNKNIRAKGLQAVNGQLVVYTSSETHTCVKKAIEVIGVGSDYLRLVPVDEHYRIRLDALRDMIASDKQSGLLPFCIIGNAGTVNTGAIDDLDELASISKKEACWFHVDGAFGAIPKLLPEFEQQLAGIEKADSLAFDFHKWLYVNYEVGCVLIRDGDAHRNAFSVSANYLLSHEKGLAAGPEPFSNFGMELSRGFKALKVWMSLKEHGIEKYQRLIRQNIQQAQFLSKLVEQADNFELLADVSLNIVCYRYNPGNLSEEELNTLNKNILMQLQEQGIAAPSYTLLQGRYAIRVAITNHRSRLEDFEILIDATRRIGKELYEKNYSLV
ncbi:MAG: amino acid decarboxylase [Chitinophagaceae bacterium]|nr:amino acid decarboxylase [Chitinophagaceae bacterium]